MIPGGKADTLNSPLAISSLTSFFILAMFLVATFVYFVMQYIKMKFQHHNNIEKDDESQPRLISINPLRANHSL